MPEQLPVDFNSNQDVDLANLVDQTPKIELGGIHKLCCFGCWAGLYFVFKFYGIFLFGLCLI